MESLARMEPGAISTLFREYSAHPIPISAFLTIDGNILKGRTFNLSTEWSQSETVGGARLRYAQQWVLIQNNNKETDIDILPPNPGSLLHGELLSSYSPSGDLKAVVRETSSQRGHQFLEVWSNYGMKKVLDLTALNKHGRVYEDGQFGCLAWSACESRVLYVAEWKRPTVESSDSASSPSAVDSTAGPSGDCSGKEDGHLFWDDWGEGLTSKSVPVLCVADVGKGTVTVLQGVPPHVSPGQALWAHDGQGVFFVGWWHEPFRLGLRFCSNRRSALFSLDLEGNCECLCGDTNSVSSPRLSPDGCFLVYLQGQVFGPHGQCLSMQQYDLEKRTISVLVDVVQRPKKEDFAGLYEALPPRCWAADSQRVVFSSARRNWRDLFVVDRTTRRVTRLSDPEIVGSWKLLTIQNDLMVVHCSHLNEAPRLAVAFLPSAGLEAQVSWDPLDEGRLLGVIVDILDISPTPQEDNPEYSGLDFGALLVTPNHLPSGTKVPLVVFVHGGPHSQFFTEWNVTSAGLATLGFAVLMVNYRGSTGFGQDSILSLTGNIGSQDVKDVQRAVLTAISDQTACDKAVTLDPNKVVVMGGSHGGFLACHLIGQYPDFYKACVVRNPVINAATLLGTSDIVDWRYSCMGLQYSYDQLPTPEALTTMLQKSPITHAPQIKAPVLLLLGGKDRRVSPHQGLELYRALKSRGSPVRLLWFEEDGHSLDRVDTQADCFLNTVLWFQQHLHLH
ncbi:S9 family peptidase isoform X1 [Esox lucius]|uniref:Acylamino-acid-releasing enzyme n=2 Tax=Esox lucius TaxID=8010 RepID=A0A3P8ZYZ0_ESOLU|nr:S9 family peptidase isoform X1 [Esox lucius]